MSNLIIVDRFEGDLVLCETESRKSVTLRRNELPAGLREGDCLRPQPGGGWVLDPEETRLRRSRNIELFRRLSQKNKP